MRPRIIMDSEDGFSMDTGHFVINLAYSEAVSNAGGLPLAAFDVLHAEEYADMADGLLLTGGPDIHAYWFGDIYKDRSESTPFSRTRDDLDFALCKLFLERGKPILGLGRGAEVVNVALGGKLYKDISRDTGHPHPDENAPSEGYDAITSEARFVSHPVSLEKGSRLANALGENLTVNSCHHMAVKTLGTGLRAAAHAPDGIIEAIEHESLPFFGVMWHPEREGADVPADGRIFSMFVQLCKEGK